MKWLDEFWWYNGDVVALLNSLWVDDFAPVCSLVVMACLLTGGWLVMMILVELYINIT